MDFKNFEATSTYAIEAAYRDYWNLIPDRYKLFEKSQRQNGKVESKSSPLSYKDVENKDEYVELDQYDRYVETLNDPESYFDFQPFFDPELTFENRLHYKLTAVDYPKRQHPWFIITWNFGQGLLESSLTSRRFPTATCVTPSGEKVVFNFQEGEMDLTLCVTSNTLQGLIELQEIIKVARREKDVVMTAKHSVLGSFPVSLDRITGILTKLPRDKGTLCNLIIVLKMTYPVIHNIKPAHGVIERINAEVDSPATEEGPDAHQVLARETITIDETETQ